MIIYYINKIWGKIKEIIGIEKVDDIKISNESW